MNGMIAWELTIGLESVCIHLKYRIEFEVITEKSQCD